MRSSSVEEVGAHGPGDPFEVFTALAILVVEGRTAGGERGYHAGPHCPLPQQVQHKHSCDLNDQLCVQAGALVRQLRVMWGVGVGVNLEVLVAPECEHGAALATTLDTTTAPSHSLKLIEQWSFTIYDRRLSDASATGWSLLAAVRSFLHFSQLSAWLSVSRGRRPPNVLYRLTVSSPVFCSKFTEDAEEHVFPLAYMGQETSIKVAVRSLPRSEKVPVVVCAEPHEEEMEYLAQSSESSSQTPLHGSKGETGRCDEDLRRSVMKARLVENTRVSRSESPDTQLGESLLDPPNSLTRFPRRYQSPSRSGSPSLETPEHLICRHRPPAPSNTRPPDMNMTLAPLAARHPFSWTQTRYPMTVPIAHHPSADPVCTVSPDTVHLHHHQDQIPQDQIPQNPYRLNYPAYCQQYQRPQLAYSRPHMGWPQAQQMLQHKPQPVHPHAQHQQQLFVKHCGFDQPQQKLPSPISPRGGKYQHYPEYRMPQIPPDYRSFTREYPEVPNPLGSSNLPGEYVKHDPYLEPKLWGEYADVSSHDYGIKSSCLSGSQRDKSSTLGSQEVQGEYLNTWENYSDHGNGREHYLKQLSQESELDSTLPKKSVKKDNSQLGNQTVKLGTECKPDLDSLHNVMDDQLRPCCSHTGKHLCSSLEDLSEACDKEQQHACSSFHPKDLKEELKSRGAVSPSHLLRGKINFDLTPRETLEILSVLRQPTPVPPLRIDRHTSQPGIESPHSPSESKTLSSSNFHGREKDVRVKFARDGERKAEERCWRESSFEPSVCWKDGNEKYAKDVEKKAKLDNSLCKDRREKAGPKSFHYEYRGHDEKCHKEHGGRRKGVLGEFVPNVENQFLEAIARTGETPCDISSCKTLVSKCESYRTRTRVCSGSNNDICDKNVIEGIVKESSYDSKDLRLEKDINKYTSLGDSLCVEAKKITHKTNFFTANSEPAKAVNCLPQKLTSQTLMKRPFSAILSSIQKEYNDILDDEQDLSQGSGIYTKPSSEEKDKVKRALTFDEGRRLESTCDTNVENPSVQQQQQQQQQQQHSSEKASSETEQQRSSSQENGTCVEQRLRDTRQGFLKSSSLLRQLMTRVHQTTQENSTNHIQKQQHRDDRTDEKEQEKDGRQQSNSEDIEVEDNELFNELRNLHYEIDDEIEKICNGKGVPIPSASEKAQFRRSLDSATNMVFHSKTGLPLTSSPAPLRKGKRFDYDSTLNSVRAIKRSTSFHCSALYTCDSEEEGSYTLETLADYRGNNNIKPPQLSASAPATVTCSNLLGSFEECVLNGRLEPVSTVQGFTAEIAASGAFCPKRTTKPVTVFFYTLCDNDQISSPYMGHINLGKKGYHVPNKGTVQVTLFNPHGTVVKMFVVMYDLSDMPPNSRTFVRQRTLNMPVGATDSDPNAHQWLRYLIHLRFVSSKSGKIYLHTDIRMLIFRKSDADAATLHKTSIPYELRSFTHGPTNPKFSPRK